LVSSGLPPSVPLRGALAAKNDIELTALGDPVNVAARLASAAGAGEILVADSAAIAAGLVEGSFERRNLDLKGKSEPVSVLVLTT
jgi:adenylate cyclase